uniref:Tetraspanin n=1 Tax=Malurus cyaneus samueli TaxID=2593467 RepID=A0A8C5TZM9_9PASS
MPSVRFGRAWLSLSVLFAGLYSVLWIKVFGLQGNCHWCAGLSYVGAYVINTYKTYDNFLQDKYALLPAVIIICVAVVMFIIGLIGCCATFRESRVGLGLFLAIILVIFIAEVSAFVLGFVYREKVSKKLLRCCGVKNYSDWTTTQWFNSTGNDTVPQSCCQPETNCTGRLDQPQKLYTRVRMSSSVPQLDEDKHFVTGQGIMVLSLKKDQFKKVQLFNTKLKKV